MTDIRTDEVKVAITDLPDASPSDPLEALSWLGETVEEIAEGLRARGIKGTPEDPSSCPLHRYLKEWFPYNLVGGTFFYGNSIEDEDWTDFPAPIQKFVKKFDDLEFPDLIDNG